VNTGLDGDARGTGFLLEKDSIVTGATEPARLVRWPLDARDADAT
jgi:hypothetical protein